MDEIEKVFETSVEMGLNSQFGDLWKVGVVHVRINAKKTLKYDLINRERMSKNASPI